MRSATLGLLALTLLLLAPRATAQDYSSARVYNIALNGTAVTVDGDLSDWADAEFVFMSQDSPVGGFFAGGDVTTDPDDFSANVAMKMDDANVYFAALVRDVDGVFLHTPFTNENAGGMFQKDHFAAYLGLYDIGDALGSPHAEVVDITFPTDADSILFSGRTYRISPDYDEQGNTLGADYQIGTPIQPYVNVNAAGAFIASGEDVITKNWGYVDSTIANTDVAIALREDNDGVFGYILEWKVPFASLAGQIGGGRARETEIEWPLYEPTDGDLIVFDFDLTDEDRPDETGGNFLRYSTGGALFNNSINFGGRGVVRDVSGGFNDGIAGTYYAIQYNGDDVTVDGDLGDWGDAGFIGMSIDAPNHGVILFGADQDSLTGPNDFSAFIGMKMDDDDLYFAGKVRDANGTFLLHDPFTRDNANLNFQRDHFAAYLGLYDIGTLPGSPHEELVIITEPDSTNPLFENARTYRITDARDNLDNTLGADYQLTVPMQAYANTLTNGAFYAMGEDAINYNGGYVDTLIANTEFALLLDAESDDVYSFEWKVPLASLAGRIGKGSNGQSLIDWPLYEPASGDVIPFDMDLTDDDRAGAELDGLNNFLRYKAGETSDEFSSLWRDSFEWSGRGIVNGAPGAISVDIETIADETPAASALRQNYPNPFSRATTIPFDVQAATHVTLTVFDLMGREVARLVDQPMSPGRYETTFEAGSLSAGMYLFRIQIGETAETGRMMLVR